MTQRSLLAILAVTIGLASAHVTAQAPAAGQGYVPPKTANGLPDLQGVWQVNNTAAEDLESHAAKKGVPAGLSVVEGDKIPYLPAALAMKKEKYEKSLTASSYDFDSAADPLAKCLFPGVPRITYLPHPFQIFEFPDQIVIVYEYLHLTRYIFMDNAPAPDPDVIDFYMGYARGRWEGDTLVVDNTNFNAETWFDKAANFHSDALHVVERFTRTSPDVMMYEATIEDPKTFSRPWKISMPLYRRQEKNVRLLESECYDFREKELSRVEEAAEKR